MMSEDQHIYDPSLFFSPRSFADALGIAITAEDTTVERRNRVETPYFVDIINEHIKLTENSRVMDFGCGPGRISKEILTRYAPKVYGVDFSPPMRAFAAANAAHPNFLT